MSNKKNLFDYQLQQPFLDQRRDPQAGDAPTLPTSQALSWASVSLPDPRLPHYLAGNTDEKVVQHIANDIFPALSGQKSSPRYYGFVTGGVLPIAEWADNVVSMADQNVQVHLPDQTISTTLEDRTLTMILDLLRLGDRNSWTGRTFTTGATSSNILGLACGREAVVGTLLNKGESVADLGILEATLKAGVNRFRVFTSSAHSSLFKAASVVGLGRNSVHELPLSPEEPWRIDLAALERELSVLGTAAIIVISAGEVNTGRFATTGIEEMRKIRQLANQFEAWIHVDGAFGIFARALEQNDEFKLLHQRVEGLELADSITVDGHKLLNVPYDCGMFFTRSVARLKSVFTNPNAAYLSSGPSTIPSPLNVGIENSRRFRALPAYAVLMSEGRLGMAGLLANMVQLSRRVAEFLHHSKHYELLPELGYKPDEIFMIVLFRAVDPALNEVLVSRINNTRQMYVSGTVWKGRKAVRMAVSTWMVNVERDFNVVSSILTGIATDDGVETGNYDG